MNQELPLVNSRTPARQQPLGNRVLRGLRWIAVLIAVTVATPALAQQKPVMENVFYNVVWGSATGAVLGAAASVIAAKDKTNPPGLRQGVFQGATAGGLIGLGVGVWLVFAGINFDTNGSTLTNADLPPLSPTEERALALASPPPLPLIALEMSPTNPGHVTGFRAAVLDIKF
jgi:hypothetical protein